MAYELKDRQGNVVQRDGEVVFVADAEAAIKGVNLDRRELTIIGSNETRDRDGDVIALKGWNFQNYAKNPVFLWGHDYGSVPIGACKRLTRRRDPAVLEFQIRFPTEQGVYPFADMVLQLYGDNIVKASSVGFIPKKWEPLEKDGEEDAMMVRPGRRFVKQELLELSGCAVPSNPDAVTNMLKGYSRFAGLAPRSQENIIHLLLNGPTGMEEEKRVVEVVEHEISKEMEFVDELEGSKHFVPREYFEDVKEEKQLPVEPEKQSWIDELKELTERYKQVDQYIEDSLDDVLRPVVLSYNEGTRQVDVIEYEAEEPNREADCPSHWESMLETDNIVAPPTFANGGQEAGGEQPQTNPPEQKSKPVLTPEQGERITNTVESLRRRFPRILGGKT